MRIAVIAHNLHGGGSLTVGKSIISTLLHIAPGHEYLVIVPAGCGYVPEEVPQGVQFIEAPYTPRTSRMKWEKLHLYRLLRAFNPDWLWGLGNLAYPAIKCRQSILLHNAHRVVYHKGFRRSISLRQRFIERYLDWRIWRDIKHVDRVYCQTQLMRHSVCEKFGIPMEKTGLCSNAVTSSFVETSVVPPEISSYYNNKFIMFVPTRYYPSKNLEILIDTYVKHREKLAGTVCVLLVSEDQDLGADIFVKRIRSEKLENQLICLGGRAQELMPQFYFAADAMMLPTELESFSGSYIEAMLFGRPILTSNLPFATELCGDAALYFNQRDPDDVCRAILELLNSKGLRDKLVHCGTDILRKMPSWREIVGSLLDNEGIDHD